MEKRNNKKRARKIRNIVVACALCAIVLTVSTYAWFIGMKTVNVSKFDVKIATTEGLFLSMDGENWSYTLDAKNTPAYTKNTNSWAESGLIPMSSVGDMDPSVSRMKLFEKGSLTTTKGGYRLLASRVDNYKPDVTNSEVEYNQGKGYVVFDLFIKNLSGNEYYDGLNVANEEAIYLTTNSKVDVKTSANGGTGIEGTGIENSVRVAFTQIGRISAGNDNKKVSSELAPYITAMTCANKEASGSQPQVTGICRDAEIWEPNDMDHVQNAINWYEKACKTRKSAGTDVSLATSYNLDTACSGVTKTESNSTYNHTYVIANELNVGSNVDVYDGADYNTYTANTQDYATYSALEDKSTAKLVEAKTFTDTDKMKTGTNRPTFMTLAPNSITKLRVYVYIEGQDIDNYDFASLGQQVTINFGFTKERFKDTDVSYDGVADTKTTNEGFDWNTVPTESN